MRFVFSALVSATVAFQTFFCCCTNVQAEEKSVHSCCDEDTRQSNTPAEKDCCPDCYYIKNADPVSFKQTFTSVFTGNDTPISIFNTTLLFSDFTNPASYNSVLKNLSSLSVSNTGPVLKFVPSSPRAPPIS